MSILKPKRNIKKDLEKVRKISNLVEKQLENYKKKNQQKITKLSSDELQDLNEILRIADLILTKHEFKKDFHSMLKEFVEIINKSAESVEKLDDEISELIISAGGTINRIKTLQNKVSDDFDFEAEKTQTKSKEIQSKTSANNLTKSSTGVYTQEYQQNSTVETEQVI